MADSTGLNIVATLQKILDSDPPKDIDATRFFDHAWITFDAASNVMWDPAGANPANYWVPINSDHPGYNQITIYRKISEGTAFAKQFFELRRATFTFFEPAGDNSPSQQAKLMRALGDKLIPGISHSPVLDETTLDTASKMLANTSTWLTTVGQSDLKGLMDATGGDGSQFQGTAAEVFLWALNDLHYGLGDLNSIMTDPSNWSTLLANASTAITTFKNAMTSAWNTFTANTYSDPNQLMIYIVNQIESQVHATDSIGWGQYGIQGVWSAPWNFTFPDIRAEAFDLNVAQGWADLNTAAVAKWKPMFDTLNTAVQTASSALLTNLNTLWTALGRGVRPIQHINFPGQDTNTTGNDPTDNGAIPPPDVNANAAPPPPDVSSSGSVPPPDVSSSGSVPPDVSTSEGGAVPPPELGGGSADSFGGGSGDSVGAGVDTGLNGLGDGLNGLNGPGDGLNGVSAATFGPGSGADINGLGTGGAGTGDLGGAGLIPPVGLGTGIGGLGSGGGSSIGPLGSGNGTGNGSGNSRVAGVGSSEDFGGLGDPGAGTIGGLTGGDSLPRVSTGGPIDGGGHSVGSIVGPLGQTPAGYTAPPGFSDLLNGQGGFATAPTVGGLAPAGLAGEPLSAAAAGADGAAGGGYPFMPPMGGGMGGMGGGRDNEKERERTTWLAEEEAVWGTDPDVAPAVVGADEDSETWDGERVPTRRPAPRPGTGPTEPTRPRIRGHS